MKEQIISQFIMEIGVPFVFTAGSILIGWIGKMLGNLLREKTNNEATAFAVNRFTDAISGAVAEVEQMRLALPAKLDDRQKVVLKNAAINKAKRVVGDTTLEVLSKYYGNVSELASGIVEDQVGFQKTDKSKLPS